MFTESLLPARPKPATAPVREYGNGAILGLTVPQANPVVEPEFGALLPQGFTTMVTRLQGSRTDSRQRMADYLANLQLSLDAYDTARPDAVGYACTGSSYVVGAEEEQRALADAGDRFGYPVISSAQAIRAALAHLDARRIAVFAPYPPWMVELSKAYWIACGMDVSSCVSIALDTTDTRDIYAITTPVVMQSFEALRWEDADAILFTGTGMPTLRAIAEVSERTRKPVLSSNLCLAWALVKAVGGDEFLAPAAPGEPLFGGWSTRIPV